MVSIEKFHLEEYFARYEFVAKNLLCCSDCESWSMQDILSMADEECLLLWQSLRLGYTETMGLPQLRQECAKVYESADISMKNILMFAGAEEGIYCTMKTLLKPEDHAIVFTPCYQSLLSIAETVCSVTRFDLYHHQLWAPDISKLEKAILPGKTKLVVMNFPHNPTGSVVDKHTFYAIIELAQKYDIWLFCDEVYRGIERLDDAIINGVAVPAMPKMVAAAYEKGISLGGLSKSHGMPGLRMGWICMQNTALLEEIGSSKHYLSICNSAPSEVLGLIAVRNREKIWLRNKLIVEQNIQWFESFLAKYSEYFRWVKPDGGCCGFLEVNIPNLNLDEVAEKLAQEKGLLILPGSNFPCEAANRKAIDRHMRIGYGRKNFPDSLALFEECLPEYFGVSKK